MRRLAPKLALLLFTAAITLVGAEFFVRARYEGRFARRPRFYVADETAVRKTASHLDHVYHGADYSTHVRTDAFGNRLGKLGPIPDDVDLIILSGDSYTFGWGVSTEETFASRFDELATRRSGGRVRAVNLGVGGYSVFQSAVRLRSFLEQHPSARVRGVVFAHCVNDACDNAHEDRLAAMLGLAEMELHDSLAGHNRSRSQLFNMIRSVSDRERIEDDLRDTGATWKGRVPERFDIGDTSFARSDFVESEYHQHVLLERRELSPLQSALMKEAVAQLHHALEGRDTLVLHQFLFGTPGWYAKQVGELARNAPDHGNTVRVLGIVPRARSFTGKASNDHAGGHFTPELNAFWAEALHERLQAHAERLGLKE